MGVLISILRLPIAAGVLIAAFTVWPAVAAADQRSSCVDDQPVRRLSLIGKEKKQFAALLDVLQTKERISIDNTPVLEAFAECWAEFVASRASETDYSGYAAIWDNQQLRFSTPDKEFLIEVEATAKLPFRIDRIARKFKQQTGPDSITQALWYVWTETVISTLGSPYNIYIYANDLPYYYAHNVGRTYSVGFVPRHEGDAVYVERLLDSRLGDAGIGVNQQILDIRSASVEDDNPDSWWFQLRPFNYTLTFANDNGKQEFRGESIAHLSESVQFLIYENIAYTHIQHFNNRTATELSRHFRQVNESTKGFILDVRDNSGGTASPLAVDYFLKPDQYVLVAKEDKGAIERLPGSIAYFDQPVVVLQNENSASMSEVLAGMLQSQGRATVIGTQSTGKSVGQTEYAIHSEGALMLVERQYYYADGVSHWGDIGVKPDFAIMMSDDQAIQARALRMDAEIDFARLLEVDPHLSKAFEILGEQQP